MVIRTPVTLYAIPFACSLAPHIALVEAALDHDIVWVRRQSRAVGTYDTDFSAINPRLRVPVLRAADGHTLTENVAVLLAIAELRPDAGLAPPATSPQRHALHTWLSFIATELHKQVLSPHFDPAVPAEMKAHVVTLLPGLLAHVDAALDGAPGLVGERFTIADAYLAWVLLLMPQLGVRVDGYPALATFLSTVLARPSVRTALAIERRIATS